VKVKQKITSHYTCIIYSADEPEILYTKIMHLFQVHFQHDSLLKFSVSEISDQFSVSTVFFDTVTTAAEECSIMSCANGHMYIPWAGYS